MAAREGAKPLKEKREKTPVVYPSHPHGDLECGVVVFQSRSKIEPPLTQGTNEKPAPRDSSVRGLSGEIRLMLSNFFVTNVTFNGVTYSSLESAYHAQKFSVGSVLHNSFAIGSGLPQSLDPAAAKRVGGKKNPAMPHFFVRDDQGVPFSDRVMAKLITCKFSQNVRLAEALMATGNSLLLHQIPRSSKLVPLPGMMETRHHLVELVLEGNSIEEACLKVYDRMYS